jgi:hypothetical protein
VWSDPSVPWSAYDVLVVRSTWDYHLHLAEFLAWVRHASTGSRLWNPAPVLRWNCRKSYLLDLEGRGVPIVPTRICPSVEEAASVARRQGWERFVVKPTVSAGGYHTYRVDARALEVPGGAWRSLAADGDVLVQPYLEAVETAGERSLVFLDGEYSHAFLRAPRLAPTSPLQEGAPLAPDPVEIQRAREALVAAPASALYARVDLVPDPQAGARLMELELIEPALELRLAPGAAGRFAEAILAGPGGREPARSRGAIYSPP